MRKQQMAFVSTNTIADRIHIIRGHKVMLDRDLAQLYGIQTGLLNLAVKRNLLRFPSDFMFQLTSEEADSLILQFAISKGRGGSRRLPYAFTEQGVAMLSSVLRSPRAVQVNIAIMRAFVKLKQVLSNHHELEARLKDLENKVGGHGEDIRSIFQAIRQLMEPPAPPRKKHIGFRHG